MTFSDDRAEEADRPPGEQIDGGPEGSHARRRAKRGPQEQQQLEQAIVEIQQELCVIAGRYTIGKKVIFTFRS